MSLGPLCHFAVENSLGWLAELLGQTELLVPLACVGTLEVHPNWEVAKAPPRIVNHPHSSILRVAP